MQLSELATILGSKLQGQDVTISSINIDTRELEPGELFIAVKGDTHDGHDFLQSACEKKAVAAIVSTDVSLPIPSIKVDDTRSALGKIAAFHRKLFNIPVIAITGSCGKTTTKTMLASILELCGPTLASIKSFNNDIGVPLTLLQINKDHKFAVIEMGANHPGEIGYLSSIAKQDIAVITNVAPAHLAGFGTIEGVATTKGEIYSGLPDSGVAVVNNDDGFSEFWKKKLSLKNVITFGVKNKSDVMAVNISLDEDSKASFDVLYPNGKFSVNLPLIGEHNIYNALAAIAIAYKLGATQEAMINGLAKVVPVSKRLIKYKGIKNSVIIDDTYNANPASVNAALEMLNHAKGEKIFVFGDMGELGKDEVQFHIEVGQRARALNIDKLYACGILSAHTVNAFGPYGFYFGDQISLIEALKKELSSHVTVLVKGSRSSRMENIVQALVEDN